MPLLKACTCGATYQPGQRCPRCAQARQQRIDDRRGTSTERGYDATWRRLRKLVLMEEPLCRSCEARGRFVAAREVDHIVPIAKGGGRLDRDNLQPLCKPCHSAKTMRESVAGGPGAPRIFGPNREKPRAASRA